MDAESPLTRFGFLIMAATAGAITSLYTQQWRRMTAIDVTLSVFVAMAFSLFAVPWLVSAFWRIDDSSLRAACAITYLGAAAAHIVIPLVLERLKERVARDEESEQ